MYYKVHFHYEVGGEAKSHVAGVFMSLEDAREYILGKFDDNVEARNEHKDSDLGEGRLAEICREIILKNYTVEYVKEIRNV